MTKTQIIIISQSEMVNYAEYSKLPVDRLSIYSNLIYPRMVRFNEKFYSHLDLLNIAKSGISWEEADFTERRKLYNIWNLPGFVGIHLADYLSKFNIKAAIVNNFDAEWDMLCDYYEKAETPPLIGISTTFHLNYSEIIRMTKKIKSRYPESTIVLGGAYINSLILNQEEKYLENFMIKYQIDFMLYAFNSESDLKDLILSLNNGPQNINEVNNLIIRDGDKIFISKAIWHGPVINEAISGLNMAQMPFLNQTLQMRSSSGCAFRCAFCSYPNLSKGLHLMPMDIFEKNLEFIHNQQKISKLIFIDDTFNIPKERFRQICKILKKFDFEWFSFLRVQFVDAEIGRLMKESGCRGVYLGIESANDNVLKNMNKKATRAAFTKGINILRQNQISIMASFVIGFPGETENTVKDNIQFIESLQLDFYTLKEFFFLPQTTIHERRKEYGLEGIGNKWQHNTMNSDEAYKNKVYMFNEIKNSVFIDPDTSLWYLAYLYDQGFSFENIKEIQRNINQIMKDQLNNNFDDNHAGFTNLKNMFQAVKN